MAQNHSTRTIEKSLEIAAPVDAVWKALTDAEHLIRWFPLEATVTPGVGGAITMSWKNEFQFNMPIAAWEPNRHLRLIYVDDKSVHADPPAEGGSPFGVAVDYHLEGRGGKTLLRLVHSGFSAAAEWDEQYDGTVRGWDFELFNLKLFLERHRSTPRRVVTVRSMIPGMSRSDAWCLLTSRDGLLHEGSLDDAAPGRPYAIKLATGDRFTGDVVQYHAPKGFAGTVENLNDALLRVDIAESWGKRDVTFWLSTYGLPDEQTTALDMRITDWFGRLFGATCP